MPRQALKTSRNDAPIYAKGTAVGTGDVDLLVSSDVKGLKYYGMVEKLRTSLQNEFLQKYNVTPGFKKYNITMHLTDWRLLMGILITVTMNTYTHVKYDDAKEEFARVTAIG